MCSRWRRRQHREDRDRGAVIVIVALSLTALLIIAALVVDVGYAYSMGRQEQTVADLSAIAAARHLPGDPTSACTAGWAYITANLSSLPAAAVSPCSAFPSSCDDTISASDYTATATGDFTVTFRYPVPDDDSLMSSRAIVQPADGTNPCDRFGVRISHRNASFFSGIAGIGRLNPNVSAVARHWTGRPDQNPANLVSLDPIGCVGIEVNGASNTQNVTEVIVNSYTTSGPSPKTIPGAIAVDSNGTSCSGGKTTVDAAGAAQLYAEPTTGSDPGQISLYAMAGDQVTCSIPACNPAQVPSDVAPQPISSAARVTRAPADDYYNCKSTYPLYDGRVEIAGCDTSEPGSGGPYIDELTQAIRGYSSTNLPPGFMLFPSCSPANGTYVGNFWVDCPNGNGFKITNGSKVVFEGNVIFNGNVNQSGGELDFEGNPSGSMTGCEPPWNNGSSGASAGTCLSASSYSPAAGAETLFTDTNGAAQRVCQITTSSCASFVYLNGSMTPSGSSYVLNFNGTFVYVTGAKAAISQDPSNYGCAVQSSANSLTSNGGAASWIAPTDGLFKNLALWSESGSGNNSSGNSSTASFGLHGGGNATVDGVFFTPCAQFNISGSFTNPQTAQFLTFQLSVGGGSQLIMDPEPQRMLPTAPSGSLLIR